MKTILCILLVLYSTVVYSQPYKPGHPLYLPPVPATGNPNVDKDGAYYNCCRECQNKFGVSPDKNSPCFKECYQTYKLEK